MRILMTIIGACLLISTAGCAYYDGYTYRDGYGYPYGYRDSYYYGRPTYYGYRYRPYGYYDYGFWRDRRSDGHG
jgi:hypothetical protein